VTGTATPQGLAGNYASSRRGSLEPADIRKAEALRKRVPPVSWANIAKQLMCCEADLVRICTTPQMPVKEREPVEETSRINFRWTDAQTGYLIARYYADGPDAVALVLGCSSSIVKGKAYRLGLALPRGWNNAGRKLAA